MPDRLDQVVAGEPSCGTMHPHIYSHVSSIYSNTAPVANTFYTVTVGGLPAGTKAVEIVGYLNNGGVDELCVWRPYGSSDTVAQSSHRLLAMHPVAATNALLRGIVTVDASGRFEIAVSDANDDIYVNGYSFYWVK